MEFPQKIKNKYLFVIIGICLAVVVPGVWYLLQTIPDFSAINSSVYLYMFVSISVTFGLFGYWVGSSQDFLTHVMDQDNLTVLLNQRAFTRMAEYHYSLGTRYKDCLSVIMVDIDYFKNVNDSHNHLVGSAVLKKIGHIISDSLRETDVAARFGGDEFVICLPRTGLDKAHVVAERLRRNIEDTEFTFKDSKVRITASFGVAAMQCDEKHTVESLVESADKLLYEAKESGRNRVAFKDANDQEPRRKA